MLNMVGWERFDVFLFLRPDVECIDPLDLEPWRPSCGVKPTS